jgi:hypothetical protein
MYSGRVEVPRSTAMAWVAVRRGVLATPITGTPNSSRALELARLVGRDVSHHGDAVTGQPGEGRIGGHHGGRPGTAGGQVVHVRRGVHGPAGMPASFHAPRMSQPVTTTAPTRPQHCKCITTDVAKRERTYPFWPLLCPATLLEEESILNALARHTSAAGPASGLPDGLHGWRFRRSLGPPGPCRRRPA